MKIIKRKSASPIQTMSIFVIPTITYFIQSLMGIVNPNREWIWWVGIPTMAALWFVVNFKIKKQDGGEIK
jgi:hypothetical protein